MTLQPGTRVDGYELTGPLGAGGMGEVYQARDTRLGRLVALKVLPRDLTSDPAARDRLEREARTLASVNHPHVCSLFDVTEHEQQLVLVMEHLEGDTLARRLTAGRLKRAESLRIGIEIADALAAVHRAGIVHRDLKPANVMLTRSGAKLLDFGIAKLRATAFEDTADTVSRHDVTAVGTIAGTLAYMAPEQLEGRPVDARTDVWALGCVLYEMATGRRAFDAGTGAGTIGRILDHEPASTGDGDTGADRALDRVIRKCLAKDPDARWQSTQDLRDELKWIAEESAPGAPPAAAAARPWRLLAVGAAIGAVIAGVVGIVRQPRNATEVDPPVSRLELTLPRLGSLSGLALSPDGRQLAFIAEDAQGQRALWVRRLSEASARQLPGTLGAYPPSPPFWSPDGRWLAFVADNKLKKIDVAGATVLTIADLTGEIMGGDWGPDGTLILGTQQASSTHGVHSVPAAGGTLAPLVPLEPGAFLQYLPMFLPDGRRFLYGSWAPDENHRELCLASLDDTAGRCLGIKAHAFGGFAADGHIAYARAGTLFAQPFDLTAGRVTGEPVILAEQLSHDVFGRTGLALARANTIVYQTEGPEIRQFVWIGRDGRQQSMAGDAAYYGGFDLTAGGEHIIAEQRDASGMGLWLTDVARGATTRAVTLAPASAHDRLLGPTFSGDGQRFVYRTRRAGRVTIVEQPTRGGNERVLHQYPGDGVLYLADVSADGQSVLVGIAEPGRRYAALVSPGGGDPVVIAEGPLDLSSPRLSKDMHWVAYVASLAGRAEVFVSPLPPTGERWQVSTAGGVQPAWRGDGRELFYLAPDGSMMSVPLSTSAGLELGAPKGLFSTAGLTGRFRLPGYRVTADGQRFLLNVPRDGDVPVATTTLQVVLNWTQLVKK